MKVQTKIGLLVNKVDKQKEYTTVMYANKSFLRPVYEFIDVF